MSSASEKMRMGRNFGRNICVVVVLVSAIAITYISISRRNKTPEEVPSKTGLLIPPARQQQVAEFQNDDDEDDETESEDGETESEDDDDDGEISVPQTKSRNDIQTDTKTLSPADEVFDARSPDCKAMSYEASKAEIALIIDYDGQSAAPRMIDNINRLVRYGGKMITEVVLVVQLSDELIEDNINEIHKSLPELRILKVRSDDVPDPRMVVARKVSAGVIVFVDAFNVFANKGWLEPLVAALIKHPSSIIVPHFDEVKTGDDGKMKYQVTSDRLLNDFAWPMKIQTTENLKAHTEDGGYLRSSTLRGTMFIVRRTVFKEMGEYDVSLTDSPSAHLELSLRMWMCGGSILVAPCSRVGVFGLFETLHVPTKRRVLIIADMWFGTKREVLLKTTGIKSVVVKSFGRIKELGLKCKTFEWYLSEVATNSYVPSIKATHFGRLASKAPLCARLATTDNRVEMDSCDQTTNGGPMYFELTTENRLITTSGQCLSAQVSAYIMPAACNPKDEQQHWEYTNNRLFNVWSRYCAMHVTDPDRKTNAGRQVLMAQNCTVDQTNGKLLEGDGLKFAMWDFKTAS